VGGCVRVNGVTAVDVLLFPAPECSVVWDFLHAALPSGTGVALSLPPE